MTCLQSQLLGPSMGICTLARALGLLLHRAEQSSPFNPHLRLPVNPTSSMGSWGEEKGQAMWGGKSQQAESSFTIRERQVNNK